MLQTLSVTLLCAATATSLATPSTRTSIAGISKTIGLAPMAANHAARNITSHSLTFLGVTCYNLLPDAVSTGTCQSLFAKLVMAGHVYDKVKLYDGYHFQSGHDPCFIKVENPDHEERRRPVSISMAQMILYATEILETCQFPGTGGSNTFDGNWRIVVTRKRLRPSRPSSRQRTTSY